MDALKYAPAVGPRLRPWLWITLVGFGVLGGNGVYLAGVTALTWWTGGTQQTFFSTLMVALHLVLGLALIFPFLAFGCAHLATSWRRPNRVAVRFGLALLICGMIVLGSGLVLVRLGPLEVRDPAVRAVGYWLHIAAPIVAVGLYVKHRLAGPAIRWVWATRFVAFGALGVAVLAVLHREDPRTYGARGSKEGAGYFFPSSARTSTGKFIPASTLMMDEYCLRCHKDAYDGWFHSSHRFSSFNNLAYLTSVRETRKVALKRDGDTHAARWCAGCHDPVPFFSGEFDDPNYDDVNAPTARAGITCTACHAISQVNSTRGNADYTIEEPQHYPFAGSTNPVLRFVNEALVKAKPAMHKATFLKPIHRDSQFCSTCHKVSIPYALNHYKDFLRGQNHHDTFWLSGVSGHGARSFYYPTVAKGQCADCHMPLVSSQDLGARDFDGKPGREIHDHFFPGANTGLATFNHDERALKAHTEFLTDQKVRIDLFGLREGGTIDAPLIAPLRPQTPTLRRGKHYLIEAVVRTLALGHPFSQGTADSNEIWVELIARADGKVIGHSGGMNDEGSVDPYAHFINIYMLDRNGNRIDRRNPQDIFVPLYNKQIPPGAGQVVHFGLDVPDDVMGPITLEAKVNYRKFDRTYLDIIFGKGQGPVLPVVVMASDRVELAVEGGSEVKNPPSPIKDAWQRWNDYGIGLLLEGSEKGGQKGELAQAEAAFRQVAALGQSDGWVNLARVFLREGRNADASDALTRAAVHQPESAAPWVIHWLTGQVNDRNGLLDEAIASYEAVLATKIPARGFDFSGDYEVLNVLGSSLDQRGRREPIDSPARVEFLTRAIAAYRRTLAIDSENVAAHYGLGLAYSELSRGENTEIPAPLYYDLESLAETAMGAALPSLSGAERVEASRRLCGRVKRLLDRHGEGENAGYSRPMELLGVVKTVAPAWDRETDPSARSALARALEVTHKGLHALFKPDETAEGRAVAVARKNNPAADQNAQPIVIHSLHRNGGER